MEITWSPNLGGLFRGFFGAGGGKFIIFCNLVQPFCCIPKCFPIFALNEFCPSPSSNLFKPFINSFSFSGSSKCPALLTLQVNKSIYDLHYVLDLVL